MSRSHNNGCGKAKCGMCKPHKRTDKGKGKCRKNFKASDRRRLQDNGFLVEQADTVDLKSTAN